jgi:hypothetical protein
MIGPNMLIDIVRGIMGGEQKNVPTSERRGAEDRGFRKIEKLRLKKHTTENCLGKKPVETNNRLVLLTDFRLRRTGKYQRDRLRRQGWDHPTHWLFVGNGMNVAQIDQNKDIVAPLIPHGQIQVAVSIQVA